MKFMINKLLSKIKLKNIIKKNIMKNWEILKLFKLIKFKSMSFQNKIYLII